MKKIAKGIVTIFDFFGDAGLIGVGVGIAVYGIRMFLDDFLHT